MTGSRSRNRGPARGGVAGFLACLCLFLITPSAAQVPEGPVPDDPSETPESESAEPAAPINILPGPSVAPPQERETEEADAPPTVFESEESGVQIGQLEAPDPSSIGILNEKNGGFPWSLWQGSDLTLVRRLLAHLPAPFQTPVLQDLSRRLLLSAAAVPEARTSMLEEGREPPSLLSVRIDRLAAGGQVSEIVALLDRVSSYSQDDVLEKRRVDALLLLQETSRVCDIAETAVRRSDDSYWLRVAAYCRAMAGEVDSVGRTLDLLAEVRDREDPAFQALISQMLLGESGALPEDVSLRDPSPLVFSMARTLDIALPPDVLLAADPMILRAVATAGNAALPVRLGAAEQVATFGALGLDRLTGLYAEAAFTEKEIAAGPGAVADMDGARANAFLYQQVRASSDARTRLDYLTTAWRQARREGQYALIARVHLNATRAIEPAAEFIPDAGEIVRALLMGGAVDRAAEWYEMVRQAASPQNIDATSTLLDIWPLFHLAAPDSGVPFSDNILRLWWQAQVTSTEAERVRRGRLLFTLLEAMEYEVPETFWTAVVAEPMRMNDPVPAVSLWRTLIRGGGAGRMGETLLAGLTGLGNAGLTTTSLSALSSIIGQWRAVGLEAEARRLAVTAAILRGL